MSNFRRDLAQKYDERYSRTAQDGFYFPVAPLHGFGSVDSDSGQLSFFARSFQILRMASRLDFRNCLDVGGGEAFHSMLFSSLFEASCVNADLSVAALRRGWQFGRVPGILSEAESLPFSDGSFELVLCCDVLDEVEDVGLVLRELWRVSAGSLIVSFADATKFDRRVLESVLGDDLGVCSVHEGEVPSDELGEHEARDWVLRFVCDDLSSSGRGVIVSKSAGESRFISSHTDGELLQALFAFRLGSEKPN